MAEIIQFNERKRGSADCHIIKKVIDGEIVEYVNFDALTPAQRCKLFSDPENAGAPKRKGYGAPLD